MRLESQRRDRADRLSGCIAVPASPASATPSMRSTSSSSSDPCSWFMKMTDGAIATRTGTSGCGGFFGNFSSTLVIFPIHHQDCDGTASPAPVPLFILLIFFQVSHYFCCCFPPGRTISQSFPRTCFTRSRSETAIKKCEVSPVDKSFSLSFNISSSV